MKTKRFKGVGAVAATLIVVCFSPAILAARPHAKIAKAPTTVGQRYLSRYAIDLTKLARQGKLQPVLGHHGEIGSILSTLSDDNMVSPLVIGELVSLDSAAIASGVAQNIVAGKVPDNLRDKRIFALNLKRLFRDAGSPARSAARLQLVLAELSAMQGAAILFIDDLHQLVGSYANPKVSQAVRQTLQLKQLRLIGVASAESYAEYISADQSLTSLFEVIQVDEMADSCETAVNRPTANRGVRSVLTRTYRTLKAEHYKTPGLIPRSEMIQIFKPTVMKCPAENFQV